MSEKMPVLDAEYLSRIGFTETTRGEICWFKRVAQGSIWVDAKTGLGRFKAYEDAIPLPLKFRTVSQIRWFLESLR